MPCSSCRKKVQATLPDGVRVRSLKNEPDVDPESLREVEYLGWLTNDVSYRGPSGVVYRFAVGPKAIQKVPQVDAAFFERLATFRVT